jgi:Transposase DDE domain
VNPKELRSRRLYSDILAVFARKQHLDTVQVLLCHFLAALGEPRLNSATVKSPSAISRFLNHYGWNLRAVIRVMRRHALEQYLAYRQSFRGRCPRLELIIDLTSLGKEGHFRALTDWVHTLNGVHGVHVVVLFLCCGSFRLPWPFLIWRGKGQPSPAALALKLLRGLPQEVRQGNKDIHVLADAAFSSKSFIQGVVTLGFKGFIGIPGNRTTADGTQLQHLNVQGLKVELKGLPGIPVWVFWVWLKTKKGKEQRFIISTVPRTPSGMRQTGKRRWKIEAFFKTLKSRFGFGRFGQHSKIGVLRYLCLSMLSYQLCHFEHVQCQPSTPGVWPDWSALARRVRQTFCGWVRLLELQCELLVLNAVPDEVFLV